MMMHKITPSEDYNYGLERKNTELIELTNQNLIKYPKWLSQQIRKAIIKLWGPV